jgi:hypothetical protein
MKLNILCRRCTTSMSGGQEVVECCKGTTVCEVNSGVLTGVIECILHLVCYMER